MNEMTEVEREELANEGELQFNELRRNLASGPESGRAAKRETSPSIEEEDEDLSQMSFLEDPGSRDR